MTDYKKQGASNRRKGGAFELSVRKDLEEQGFICTKWMNNVELIEGHTITKWKDGKFINDKTEWVGCLVPAKRKYNPFKKIMMMSGGFPDFFNFKIPKLKKDRGKIEQPTFVEAKSTGYLDAEEKKKADWYIKEFGLPFVIASKDKKNKGEIIYKEYGDI